MCEKCDELRRLLGAKMHGGTGNTLLGVVAEVYEYTDGMRDKQAEFTVREAIMLSAAITAIRQAGRFLQTHLRDYVMTDDDYDYARQTAAQLGYTVKEIEELDGSQLEPEDLALMHKLQVKAETMLGRTLSDNKDDKDCTNGDGPAYDWANVFGRGIGEA